MIYSSPPSDMPSRTPDPLFGVVYGIIVVMIVGVLALITIVFHPASLPASSSDVQSQIAILQTELNGLGCPSGGVTHPMQTCYPNVDGDISGDPNGTPVY